MKKFAKLILFFCLTFIISFAIVTCFKFLTLRVEWTKNLPPRPETTLTLILAAAHWALSLTLISTIIISINYAVRRKCFALISIPCIMILSFLLTYSVSIILSQMNFVPPSQTPVVKMGDKGIILTNSINKNETAVVLLNGTTEPLGPRVVAIPGQPLAFQNIANNNVNLPPVPFRDDTPWFLKNLSIDIRLNAEMIQRKFSDGFFPFLLYAGSLIFMLCSLSFIFRASNWPLANLFLSSIASYGILALISFLNTPEMQEIIASFLRNIIPLTFALPFFFLIFGGLLNIYSLLSFAAKRRFDNDD